MGVVFATGFCIGCGRLFTFNPMRVPSSSVKTGTREPICGNCFDAINAYRKTHGLEQFVLQPDAYEACDESELG